MRRLSMLEPFVVFSDVHGNLPALEAILTDARQRGFAADGLICLGDLVGYGPFPNEVAQLLRDLDIPCLMGNYDQGIGFATGDCGCVYKTDEQRAEGAVSLAWTESATNEETRAYLRTLADRFVLATPAGDLLAVHGSPRRINEYLFADRPQSAMARMAADNPYRALLFGHTHLPYVREVQVEGAALPTLFINVGSAGRPKDGDWRACYAIVDPVRLAAGEDAVKFVRVAYDYARLVQALAKTDLITTFAGPEAAQTSS